ncbi:amino acid adenylation enzyme/thioester reductase family protein [Xenococcus sp. PCC 7305]|uniref:non-ribosomal peptide synthetase n=1 Tax=Xenococcus sp. PCC 7305 TaxID=102125 RepID=UPI0002AC5AB5|nr:non-ribosomal peptide synthetase [Xenococcus sp. PCC 7305]ELS02825.1 amino acid adenylation enzyme/thioester reductase family protein [Xenococcus sp. PCC 7305]
MNNQTQSLAKKNIESIYPLSPLQQGMLFHSLHSPKTGVYLEQVELDLQGDINVIAFESAWQKVVDRHSVLRTLFVWENRPTPLQIVLKKFDLPWRNLDWQGLSVIEQKQQLTKFLQRQKEQEFKFSKAPLNECTLVKLSKDQYKLIWSFHHILIDGWCLPIILKEVFCLYEAELLGESFYLPTPRPYRKYIKWLNSQDKETAFEFWQRTLRGFNNPTSLVIDKLNEQQQQDLSDYKVVECRFSAQDSRKLQNIGQKHRLTLATIIQAAWALLLNRYSGEKDILFGVTVSGRNTNWSGVENMVGLLINTLPLRLQISSSETLITWLKQIQQLMWRMQDYSYTPLVDIQTLSELSGGVSLFESIVVFENYPLDFSLFNETNSLQFKKIAVHEHTNYPLTVLSGLFEEELFIKISYDTLRFEEDTMTRMLAHLQTILLGIIENPQQTVTQLSLLTKEELHQLLVEWNDTQIIYPQDKCIHQLFEEQVTKNPDAIAIIFEEQQLTYQQLNERANQLANYLQKLGINTGKKVGIYLERSLEMIISILGILKAGGAYVPFDPNYPQERINFMLEDSQIFLLLTKERLVDNLELDSNIVINLDQDWKSIDKENQDNLVNVTHPNSPIYLLYTSGSTGQPKGVIMNHGTMSNLIHWQVNRKYFTPQLRTLQFASISFDVACQEIFSTFCSGGTLVLIAEEERKDFNQLPKFIKKQAIERLFLPFVALEQLSAVIEHQSESIDSLQEIITAGEQLKLTPAIEKIRKQVKIISNQYGPTETHVVTEFILDSQRENIGSLPPIGKPIANTKIYILDSYLQPVPIGVTGEIYIGGVGLASEYLNRPELTKKKFIPNPFSDSPSGRLYKTGDLARYLRDGNIEFLGRVDNQVKIRGYRIEPGEIETVLAKHPQIKENIILVREDIPSAKRLVAYIVPTQEQVPSLEELRSFLKQKLPSYMIPSALVPIEAIPLTPSGKIDRFALAKINLDRQISEQTYVAPRNSIEQKLAEIWSKVLWLEHEVGIHDNFFDLGGHSLLSVSLIAEIEQAFNRKVPIAALFQLGTIAELAELLEQETAITSKSSESLKHSQLSEEIYHQQLAYTAGWLGTRIQPNSLIVGLNTKGTKQGLFWCLQGFRELSQLAKYLGEEQPVYGMRSGHLIMEYTQENIKALAAHYVAEILSIQPESPYLLGGNCQSAWIMMEIAQQLKAKDKTITLLCLMEQFIPQAYTGRVALFFGRQSRFNPYQKFHEPEFGYRKYYGGKFSVNIFSGKHGQFFNEPNIQTLVEKLRCEIEKAQLENVSEQADQEQYQLLNPQAYQAKLTAKRSLEATAGESLIIPVRIENISPMPWKSTINSGIRLGNHWLTHNGEVIVNKDGRTNLDQELLPGAAIDVNLLVTIPEEPGCYQLELDLVEEGVTWFKDQGSATTIVEVQIVNNLTEISRQNITLKAKKSDLALQEGHIFYEKGDFESAIISYQKAITLNPQQPVEVYQNLGNALSQKTEWANAIAAYQKALTLAPENAELYFFLAEAQTKQENLTAAAASYQQAVELEPQHSWFYQKLGQVLQRLGRIEKAITILTERIKLEPNNCNAYSQLASAQISKGDFKGAISNLDQALKLLPINPAKIYCQLGHAYHKQGVVTEAICCYQKAITLNPSHPAVYTFLGNAQLKSGKFQNAVVSYEQAIQLNSQQPFGVYKNLGDALSKEGDLEKAITAYQKALILSPNHQAVLKCLENLKIGLAEK